MPGITGLELARTIKARKKTANLLIVFLTAYYGEDQYVVEGYGAGAIDCLGKPLNPAILRAKVRALAELYQKHIAISTT